MSDHLDGPDFTFPEGDPRLDAADLYLFAQPNDPSRTVVVFDVNPFAAGETFHPDAVHRIGVDTDGDARDDVAFFVTFSGNPQTATVRRAHGADARSAEPAGEVIIADAPVSFGIEPIIVREGPYRFFAGRRSDPFFFDVEGATHDFHFTGTDTFADSDIFSIILELPNGLLGATPMARLWARVSVRKDGRLVPIDRVAQPGTSNGFISDMGLKAEFIADDPSNDRARYAPAFVAGLVDRNGLPKEQAEAIVEQVLPDLLPYDASKPSGFPNGRKLDDHYFDMALTVLTKGGVTTDGVAHHTDYLAEFPYLGTPHMTPPPPMP